MDKEDLEKSLNKWIQVKSIIDKHIDDVRHHLQNFPQLEPEQPKLRHGDYGYDMDGTPVVAGNDNMGPYCRKDMLTFKHDYKPIQIHIGNIFDDLSAMAEDVEEFEVKEFGYVMRVKYKPDEGIEFYIRGGSISLIRDMQVAQDFRRKLGAMIATALRKAKGESK